MKNLLRFDQLVTVSPKSRKTPLWVIPAKAEIQRFRGVKVFWTPVVTGVMTYGDFINASCQKSQKNSSQSTRRLDS